MVFDPRSRTSTTLLNEVAAGGHERAERLFYERYGRMVRALCLASGVRPSDCDDIVQETMIAAVQALREHRYDRRRAGFKVWLRGVIRHKIAHARQSAVRRPWSPGAPPGLSDTPGGGELDPRILEQIPDPGPGPAEEFEAAFEAEWQKAARDEVLDQLRREVEPQTWQAYDLLVNKGWKPREVAGLLGMTRRAVDLAKYRVVKHLRELLQEGNDKADP
jgi:RNA polymerase sigma factor (sigma-70 family)